MVFIVPESQVPASLAYSAAPLVSHEGDRTVVWLSGEQDIATVPQLTSTVVQAMAFDDADLVVDMSGVTFMAAGTIGVLIAARNDLRQQSRSLVFRAPSKSARRVLELCGIVDLVSPHAVGSDGRIGQANALGTWVDVPPSERSQDDSAVSQQPARVVERRDHTADAELSGRGGP
jgi:anti-sigma B factor antagonist